MTAQQIVNKYNISYVDAQKIFYELQENNNSDSGQDLNNFVSIDGDNSQSTVAYST